MATQILYDVVIIGGGASGLIASIVCGRNGLKTALLEGQELVCKELLMGEGGCCNVTNRNLTEKNYFAQQPEIIRNVLQIFSVQDTVRFFEGIGVALSEEEDGRLFPRTFRAQTVVDALLREAAQQKIMILKSKPIKTVQFGDSAFKISGDHIYYEAKTVIIATGGLSFQSKNAQSGFGMAKAFGHTVVSTSAALTPLVCDDEDWKSIAGTSLPCCLKPHIVCRSILEKELMGKELNSISYTGPLLFTHFGLSGPAAMNMSRHWTRWRGIRKLELSLNFLPETTERAFLLELDEIAARLPDQTIGSVLSGKLPEKFLKVFFKKTEIDPAARLFQLKKEDRAKLAKSLFDHHIVASATSGYGAAAVAVERINLAEVNPRTLESKMRSGLFFAGGVLDVDYRTAGRANFQWSWSSGVAAALGVFDKIRTGGRSSG